MCQGARFKHFLLFARVGIEHLAEADRVVRALQVKQLSRCLQNGSIFARHATSIFLSRNDLRYELLFLAWGLLMRHHNAARAALLQALVLQYVEIGSSSQFDTLSLLDSQLLSVFRIDDQVDLFSDAID